MASTDEITIEKAKSACERKISELFKIWNESGVGEETLNTYAEQVLNHVYGLLNDMVNEAVSKKKDLLQNIRVLAQSARKLSKELAVDFAADSNDDIPLMELKRTLKEQVEQLQNLRDSRLKHVEKLLSKETELCSKLKKRPVGFSSELPTEEQIERFEDYLKIQELEKNRLGEIFEVSRWAIMKMMEELQIGPVSDFERMICDYSDEFVYSQDNMNQLKDLEERLKTKVEDAKVQAQEKRDILNSLWGYINEPIENREAFLKNHSGYNSTAIKALDVEIKRCKEMRSQNVANYVKQIRIKIKELWELCKYSELQKKAFTAMKCQSFTDDLLTLHENEVEELLRYYNCNRKIYELLDEWEKNFEKLKELDLRANDPDRYHNRGGQLLMEEKERKAAEKKLPRLEGQLYALVGEFENTHKKPLLVYGLSLREFLNENREKYEVEKENMKIARKQAKDKSAKKTPLSTSKRTPGMMNMLRITPASARMRSPPGSSKSHATFSAKRKLPFEASIGVTEAKKRIMSTEKNKSTVLSTKVRRSGRTPGGKYSGGRTKSANKKNRRSKNDTSVLSVSSYGKFQNHLDDRDELRSSILHHAALDRDGDEMMLMKTPVKPKRRKVLAISTPVGANSSRLTRGTPRNPKLRTPQPPQIKISPIEI